MTVPPAGYPRAEPRPPQAANRRPDRPPPRLRTSTSLPRSTPHAPRGAAAKASERGAEPASSSDTAAAVDAVAVGGAADAAAVEAEVRAGPDGG